MDETADDYAAFALAALPSYGFSQRARVRLLSLSENGTFMVEEPDNAGQPERLLVLRVHRPGYHTKSAIESELSWMAEVREHCGIPTPELVPSIDGERVVLARVGDRTRCVDAVSVIEGETGEDSAIPVPFEELGRISASMHRFDEQWRAPRGFERFCWGFEETLGQSARWGDWRRGPGVLDADRPALEAAQERIRRALKAYGTGRGRFGLIHADLRLANVMVGPTGAITVIDFDDCGWGWYLHDLGSVVSWLEHEPEATRIASRWLVGYLERRALEPADLAMVPTFVMLRRMMLTAWLGTHPLSPPAQQFGDEYGRGTGQLAERFLDDPDWFAAHELLPAARLRESA